MDGDHLSPELGRLIDAAKTVAKAGAAGAVAAAPTRAEGWALLAVGGEVYAGPDAAAALAAARAGGAQSPVPASELLAAAFAVAGEPDDTLLPRGDWRQALSGLDPELPLVVKYLGRWVTVTLAEIPPA